MLNTLVPADRYCPERSPYSKQANQIRLVHPCRRDAFNAMVKYSSRSMFLLDLLPTLALQRISRSASKVSATAE